tara:strand:- start:70 stop:735 length:666 start_codon:yes stop_codon:yes gene_type:complete
MDERTTSLERRVAALELQLEQERRPPPPGPLSRMASHAIGIASRLANENSARSRWRAGLRAASDRKQRRKTIAFVLIGALAFCCAWAFSSWTTQVVVEKRLESRAVEFRDSVRQGQARWVTVAKRAGLVVVTAQASVVIGNVLIGQRALKVFKVFKTARVADKINAIHTWVRRGRAVAAPVAIPVRATKTALRFVTRPLRRGARVEGAVAQGGASAAAAAA